MFMFSTEYSSNFDNVVLICDLENQLEMQNDDSKTIANFYPNLISEFNEK